MNGTRPGSQGISVIYEIKSIVCSIVTNNEGNKLFFFNTDSL